MAREVLCHQMLFICVCQNLCVVEKRSPIFLFFSLFQFWHCEKADLCFLPLRESICPCCCRRLQAFGQGSLYEFLLLLNYDALIRYVFHFRLLSLFCDSSPLAIGPRGHVTGSFSLLLPSSFCPSWWIKKINRMHFKDDKSNNKVRNYFPAKCTDWKSYRK